MARASLNPWVYRRSEDVFCGCTCRFLFVFGVDWTLGACGQRTKSEACRWEINMMGQPLVTRFRGAGCAIFAALIWLNGHQAFAEATPPADGCRNEESTQTVGSNAEVCEDTPFLWLGKPFSGPDSDITQVIRDIYDPARRKYPTLQSCATGDDKSDGGIMSTTLRWEAFENYAEAEVCLFRMLAKLGTKERIEDWLLNKGFASLPNFQGWKSAHNIFPQGDNFLSLQLIWFNKAKGPLYGAERRGWKSWFALTPKTTHVGVLLDSQYKLQSVNLSFEIK